jgi:hypothetical protein
MSILHLASPLPAASLPEPGLGNQPLVLTRFAESVRVTAKACFAYQPGACEFHLTPLCSDHRHAILTQDRANMAARWRFVCMSSVGLSLNELLLIIAYIAVFTVTAAPMIRYFEKSISLLEALRIAGWATMIAFGAYFAVVLTLTLVGRASGLTINPIWAGRLIIPALFGSGWLISRRLGRIGRRQRFPGTGAKVVLCWIVLASSFVIVGRFVIGWF